MIKVMISDPDLFAREGIKRMLENERDVQVAYEAQNVSETFETLRKYQPDVCILEIGVGCQQGLSFVRETKTQAPSTPILVIGHHHERDYALRAIRAGAAGYLDKNCTDQQLATAVRTTADRRPYVSETVCELLAENITLGGSRRPHESLSDSDFEIFCLMIEGVPTTKIAGIRRISTSLARARRAKIMEKLGLRTDTDLIEYAIGNDLIEQA